MPPTLSSSVVLPTPSNTIPQQNADNDYEDEHNNNSNNNEEHNDEQHQNDSEQTTTDASGEQQEEEEEEQKETVIVFDWDDTLLSSTWLAQKGYRLDSNMTNCSPEFISTLKQLSDAVCATLRLACTYGRVHILTNAETGWVELSAAKFLPAVVPLLAELNIAILSARSTFECEYPDAPIKWKCCGFAQLLNNLLIDQTHIHKNIVSFGDSHVEREAVRTVTMHAERTLCKSVKFAERPTCEQLRRQLDLVTNCMHYILHHNNHLDLQLTVTVNDNADEAEGEEHEEGDENEDENEAEDEEKEDVMRAPEASTMAAHDDGNNINMGKNKKNNNNKSSSSKGGKSDMCIDEDNEPDHENDDDVVEAY